MRELLLSGGTEDLPEPTGDVLFLFDPGTAKDLISNQICIALANNATIDTINKIDDNPTIRFAQGTSQGLITLPTPINFEALTEWTVEWTSRPTSIGSSYFTELFLDIAVTQGYPIGCRWADGGYGNRNQFNIGNWSNAVLGQPSLVKSQAVNKDNRWAMVYKGGQLRIFYNGVLQMLAFGTGGSYSQSYIDKTQAFGLIAKIYLGYYNGTNQAWLGNMGRVRISNFARYLGNYTPVPF
ncbi:hypothetical protein D3C81_582290 [compost metagenome]